MDLSNLKKNKEQKEREARANDNLLIAQDFYKQMSEKQLQVQDAMLIVKFLGDMVSNKANAHIQNKYLSHID